MMTSLRIIKFPILFLNWRSTGASHRFLGYYSTVEGSSRYKLTNGRFFLTQKGHSTMLAKLNEPRHLWVKMDPEVDDSKSDR